MTKTDRHSIADILEIKSVAIVGVSVRMGYYWVHSMLQWKHDLDLYFVARKEGEVMGHKIYTSLFLFLAYFLVDRQKNAAVSFPASYLGNCPNILRRPIDFSILSCDSFTS